MTMTTRDNDKTAILFPKETHSVINIPQTGSDTWCLYTCANFRISNISFNKVTNKTFHSSLVIVVVYASDDNCRARLYSCITKSYGRWSCSNVWVYFLSRLYYVVSWYPRRHTWLTESEKWNNSRI